LPSGPIRGAFTTSSSISFLNAINTSSTWKPSYAKVLPFSRSLMTVPSYFSNLKYLGAKSSFLARAFLNSQTVVLLYTYKLRLPFLLVALFFTTTLSNNSPFRTALCG
jgi:hypothetical protein